MLYSTTNKKKKHLEYLRQQVNQPYIGVIETTMMYQSLEKPKEHLISVSCIINKLEKKRKERLHFKEEGLKKRCLFYAVVVYFYET